LFSFEKIVLTTDLRLSILEKELRLI